MATSGDRYHGHWRFCDQCQAADRGEGGVSRCAKGAELKSSDEAWFAILEQTRQGPKQPRPGYDRGRRRR